MTDMTQEEFLVKAKEFIMQKYGTQTDAANHYGFTPSYMSAILRGVDRVVPPKSLLKEMGVERIKGVTYRFVDK